MSESIQHLLKEIQNAGVCRPHVVQTHAMGRERLFHAFDCGEDTFVLEKDVDQNLDQHASVLLVQKKDLNPPSEDGESIPGFMMSLTTGNHSVAALPLLQGQFWDLAHIEPSQRGTVMTEKILCANIVSGKIEISQRDVPCAVLAQVDEWLTGKLNFSFADVVMVERTDQALEYYRKRGQEWRVRPLAWTEQEMSLALAASRKRISTSIRYYHGSRGVHFLSYADFHQLAQCASSNLPQFTAGLHELVSVFEGHDKSFLRQVKYHGHHEIELFGMRRGEALDRLVPALETLMEKIALSRISQPEIILKITEIDALYRSLLSRPELADDQSKVFIETLYMHLTGEVYSVMGEGSAPAFDDRRTALPGGLFQNGCVKLDANCDERSRILLSNLRIFASREEVIEYANIYELRTKEDEVSSIGNGSTREVVFKTNRRPLTNSFVEKRLAQQGEGYGSYVLSRAYAFKELGVSLPNYHLLRRQSIKEQRNNEDSFTRSRCEGDALTDIPASAYQIAGEFGGMDAGEDPQVVLALARIMGDAAAQNMVMKKYDTRTKSPLYGVGKEIYQFGYDTSAARLMPHSVSCCSVRGALGWPDLTRSDRNLDAMLCFYLLVYARSLSDFASKHPICSREELCDRFWTGFELRLKGLEWNFTVQRENFESFDPHLPEQYGFLPKWHFALWALERHVRRITILHDRFYQFFSHPEITPQAAPIKVEESAHTNAENLLSALAEIEIHFEN